MHFLLVAQYLSVSRMQNACYAYMSAFKVTSELSVTSSVLRMMSLLAPVSPVWITRHTLTYEKLSFHGV
jgi:hypothetical protein